MPKMIVFRNDEIMGEYMLVQDRTFRIGRSPDNDIVLSDRAVSSVHAEIEGEDGFFYITDFQSKNGTFINKELVVSRRLAPDDVITMGGHNLKFVYGENESQPAPLADGEDGATMHIDTEDHRSRLARSLAGLAGRKPGAVPVGAVHLLKTGGAPVFLDKPVTTIGKNVRCDIVLKGWFAPALAAEIRKKREGYYLCPVEGKPPLVNSQPLEREVLLREFDVIQVGSAVMQFQFHKTVPVSGDS